MLTLTSLFSGLCRDPSDAVLLSQLHTLHEENAPELSPYFAHEDATCHAALIALFARPFTPARWQRRLAVAQVRARHRLDQEAPIDSPLLAALAVDPLCLLILSESLNTDVTFERVCMRLRYACLLGLPIEPNAEPLLAALALQAWNNEYLWEETEEETAAVATQTVAVDAAVNAGNLTPAILPLLRWALYRPLAKLPTAEALLAHPLASVPPVLRPLWQRTLLAQREEAVLRAALPSVGQINDSTSRAVQAQHDENPYPRWVRLGGAQRPVLEYIRGYSPRFAWPATFREPLQILVAGCGTGQHPLSLAVANRDAEVLALDLSGTSLAYAQRMARALGIHNIHFLQGDLLQLPAWGRPFHHIECVGVLQNLGDQQAAWQSLTAVLHPGGTLRVGVPSKVACLPLTHLREQVVREGVPSTLAAVRAYRSQLLREPALAAVRARFCAMDDFFSVSMVRHLFFPVQGHQYTLTELEQRATACGLRLLGYRLPRQVRRHVTLPAGPPTFAQWRGMEMAYTGGMGMFICTLYRPIGHQSRCVGAWPAEEAPAESGAMEAISV
jgi:2-polyprenyl-3-methyl-5-hydroxy-6-metoxy-1,4-benzoquinol methylase